MNWIDTFRAGGDAIRVHRLRSILTMFAMDLRHTLVTAATVTTTGVALLSLTGCGSSGASDGTAAGTGQPPAAASAGGSATAAQGSAAGGRMPGAAGQIAAKQGSTLQVQNDTDGQVAVSYTAKTVITAQVAAALKDIKVGSCVSVVPASTGAASSGDTAQSGVFAGTVRISQPVNGACTGGFGGGQDGGRPRDARPTAFPSGMPTDLASGGPAGSERPSGARTGFSGGGGMFGAYGSVTAIHGSTLVVKSSFPGADATTTTVTLDGSTTYTITTASDASALKVGQCVVATGQSDDTGAVDADRLVVSAPVDGGCSSGFGGSGRPGYRGAQGGAA